MVSAMLLICFGCSQRTDSTSGSSNNVEHYDSSRFLCVFFKYKNTFRFLLFKRGNSCRLERIIFTRKKLEMRACPSSFDYRKNRSAIQGQLIWTWNWFVIKKNYYLRPLYVRNATAQFQAKMVSDWKRMAGGPDVVTSTHKTINNNPNTHTQMYR